MYLSQYTFFKFEYILGISQYSDASKDLSLDN